MKKIHIIARCSTLYRDRQLEGSGLTGYQAPYLPEIERNPGLTQEELAQKLHVNRSSVTRQLSLLEEEGFITRQRSEADRRTIQVFPTAKLTGILPRIRSIFGDFRTAATASLTAAEVETLSKLLDKVADNAELLVRESQDIPL